MQENKTKADPIYFLKITYYWPSPLDQLGCYDCLRVYSAKRLPFQ